MRLARVLLGLWLAASACGGAERTRAVPVSDAPVPGASAPRQAASDGRAAREDEFAPPDDTGWGRAAGLRYLEEVRGGVAAGAALPMIVVLHGLGDRPHPEWIGELPVPVRLVLPQAPTPYFGGFAWFEYRAAESKPADLARGIAGAAEQLARAIAILRTRRATEGKVLVTGFSQGGMLSYALALRHPDGLALAVPIAGLLPEPLWPERASPGTAYPPIRAMHGDADTLVPIARARSLHAHLARLGFDEKLGEHSGVGHAITPAMFEQLRATLVSALAGGVVARD
jgi:phospholipase/carboxylesterase